LPEFLIKDQAQQFGVGKGTGFANPAPWFDAP
jgi:hypothetical protein